MDLPEIAIIVSVTALLLTIAGWSRQRVHYRVETAYTGADETPQSYIDDLLKTGRYQILHATYLYEKDRKSSGQNERGYIYVLADCGGGLFNKIGMLLNKRIW